MELSSDVPGVLKARDICAAISGSVEPEVQAFEPEESPEMDGVCDPDKDLGAVQVLDLDLEGDEGSTSDHLSFLRIREDVGSCAPTFFAIRLDPTWPEHRLTVVVRRDRRGGGDVSVLAAMLCTAAGGSVATASAGSGPSGVDVGGEETAGASVVTKTRLCRR